MMCFIAVTLAQQQQPATRDVTSVMLWLGILIVVTIAGGLAVLAIRRRVLGRGSETEDQGTLMDSLRGMRDRGEMTPEEFEAAKRAMVERMRAAIAAGEGGKAAGDARRRKPGDSASPQRPNPPEYPGNSGTPGTGE